MLQAVPIIMNAELKEAVNTAATTMGSFHQETPSDDKLPLNSRRERRREARRRRPRDSNQRPQRYYSEPIRTTTLRTEEESKQQEHGELIIDMTELERTCAAVGDSLVEQRQRPTSFQLNTGRRAGELSDLAAKLESPITPPAVVQRLHRSYSSVLNRRRSSALPGAYAAKGRPADLPAWVLRANEGNNNTNTDNEPSDGRRRSDSIDMFDVSVVPTSAEPAADVVEEPVAMMIDEDDEDGAEFEKMQLSFSSIPPEVGPVITATAEITPDGSSRKSKQRRNSKLLQSIRKATKEVKKEMKSFLLT